VKILVTGGSGYLGSAATPTLRARGHEVVTIGRRPGMDTAVCDLTDGDAVGRAVRAVGDFDTVVHLAARAHNFRGLTLNDCLRANTTTTGNLIAALRAEDHATAVRFVHASSVAVYDLLDPAGGLSAEQAPYAASKLRAEQLLAVEPFRGLSILRFAPIYDRTHLQDVAKRVFLPGTQLKLRLCPPPVHSLCAIECAVQAIVAAVESAAVSGHQIANITDPQPISQNELASWFPGPALPVPTTLFSVVASGLSQCGATGRKAARMLQKFANSGTYPLPGR
jgi:nucleoside-diphosphate-sugar epimerase